MGCWNKTCALSNLPIFAGERTYVFVLEESSSYCRSKAIYPNYLYDPVLLPFESTYDDYGAGENSSGIALPIILDSLKRCLIEKEQGGNKYHDVEVKIDGFDEEKFFEAAREDRLEIKTWDGPKKVKFVMMRKDLVDNILDSYVIKEYVGRDEGYKRYKFQDILDNVDELLERFSVILQSLPEHPLKTLLEVWFKYWLGNIVDDNLASRWLRRGLENSSSFCTADFYLLDVLKEGKFDEAKSLIELTLKGAFINNFMDEVRRCWVPPCGEGSQDGDFGPHKLLAQITMNVADAIERDRG